MDKLILFYLLCIFHILIWVFVLFAFLNIKMAKINLYYVIPMIYILHFLPFHLLLKSKEILYSDAPTKVRDFEEKTKISLITNFQKTLAKNCFFSPLSAQGMLIFGSLSSAYAVLKSYNIPIFCID